jgi:hypothetical protein
VFTVIEPRFTLTATLPATANSSVSMVPVVPVTDNSSVAMLPDTPSSSVSIDGVTLKDPPLPPCMLPATLTFTLPETLPDPSETSP